MQIATLTTRQLNRALLARQFLLKPSSVGLVPTVERIGGLQTQYAPSGYLGAWSRMSTFERPDLTRALEQRRIIQGTLLRSTIHMVSPRDYWLFLAAITPSRQEWFRRITRKQHPDLDMEGAARLLRGKLASGPRKQDELREVLLARGYPREALSGVTGWLHMVRVPPSGTWNQRRADLFGLAEHWISPVRHTESAGIEHVITRYLGAFGPAPLRDIADWAGVASSKVVSVANRMTLGQFHDEKGKLLYDLPRGPMPDPSTPAPVRFLPTWDATLLAHARRTQILPERFRPLIFHVRIPQSKPSFLVDGQVAGTWRYDGKRVVTEPFEPLPLRARRELDAEARRLAAFHSVVA